jgi:predicted dehydrogenase
MYKVAIVGAGIGAEHLAGYQALPERFDVRCICDLDASRGGALAASGGIAHTGSFDDVLASDVDIVDICLPPHLHFETCLAALDAGKHVVCEKPLVNSLADADTLKAKVEETGKVLSPVFQYRYGLGAAQFHALDAAGLLGTPYVATLETHWNRPASYYDINWRGTWAGENGGAILGHAIHIHDFLTHFLGPVASVFAKLGTRVNDIEVEDCAALSVQMESGALVTSSVTLGAANNTSRFRVMCEKATIESDHAAYAPAKEAWRFLARDPYTQDAVDAVLADVNAPLSGYAGMFSELADTLDGRAAKSVTLEDGRRSLEFVTAVYASGRSGMAQSLPIGADHPLYRGWSP